MRTSLLTLAAAASLAALATPAHAQADLGGGFSVSGNAAVVTDYRFRGVSFSDEDIAIQGGVDIAHESGFYIGTWGSSLEEDEDEILLYDSAMATSPSIYKTGNFGHTELDIYAGWSGEVSSGLTVDVGILYYVYPNARNTTPIATPCTFPLDCTTADGVFAGFVDFDTDYWEPYASLSYSIGPAEVTTGIAWAPSQDALGNDDNLYLYSDLSIGIPQTPFTLSGHLGYTDGSLSAGPDGDYLDWSLGVEAAFGILSIGVAYVDTDAPGDLVDSTIVGTLGVSF